MFSQGQLIVISFIILEFLLIFLFILLVYAAKLFSLLTNFFFECKVKKYTQLLNQYKKDSDCRHFGKLRSADLFLPLLNKTGLKNEQKIKLIKIILPKILPCQKSKKWQKRYHLLTALKYDLTKEYYPTLIQLIGDPIPIISIEAVRIGSSINNWDIYNAILDQLLHCDHSNQTMYIDNLHKNKAMLPFLLDQLRRQHNSQLKKIIYDMLLHIGCDASFYEAAKYDSIFGHRNMRLAAIRILPYTNREQAGGVLQSLTHEDDWLLRNVAVQSLGVLRDEHYIPDIIKRLDDPVWWVRLSAAKALVQLGGSGLQILKDCKTQIPDTFTDYAEYFYKLERLKNK
ncbi:MULTISPECIES: HEAT repeat domain-containing protein [unclassified Legionella]|uniref:HEAT repeat domain-containing protein n=1 Tax=unclassified Legionella TaxID=2622702 RepID=UPI001055CBB3|nr:MULTISPECIES: HEAT repeat domain-containing protein [unclassified Legionella]MDI9819351.1 HEAT repeat domain-containing protein [Legionella sp. PL877]